MDIESLAKWVNGQREAHDPDGGWHTGRGEVELFLGEKPLQIILKYASPRSLEEVSTYFPEERGKERLHTLLAVIGKREDLRYYLGSQYILIVSGSEEQAKAAVLSAPHDMWGWSLTELSGYAVADVLCEEWRSHGSQWESARAVLCDAFFASLVRYLEWEARRARERSSDPTPPMRQPGGAF